ncbi:MAG: hypothetical protein R3B41_03645 [Candidatus Doudnabacteria bacterium]
MKLDLELIKQYNQLIGKAKTVAVILPTFVDVDLYCAGSALIKSLQAKGVRAGLYSSSQDLPQIRFLQNLPKLDTKINNQNSLVIKVSNQQVEPKSLKYNKTASGIEITIDGQPLTDQALGFLETDVEIFPSLGEIDLIITLGVKQLDQCGLLYEDNVELFYQTPKITINNQADHEYYGAVNLVGLNVLSLSELVYEVLSQDVDFEIDQDLATIILTGIIDKTKSFRDPKTTPDTLLVSSGLVKLGARQQEIIQHLFKTKAFPLLQLWGRAMARIELIKQVNLMFTELTEQDFAKTKTSPELLLEVAKELVEMSGGNEVIALTANLSDNSTRLLLAGLPHIKLKKIAHILDSAFDSNPIPMFGNYFYIQLSKLNLSTEQVKRKLTQALEQN